MVYDFFEELIDTIKGFFIKVFNKYKYILLVLLYIILILGIFVIFDIENPINLEELNIDISSLCYCKDQELYFMNISLHNWFEWISLTLLPCTVVLAFYQYKKQTNAKNQEKAAEIAKEFANKMVEKCGIICKVYGQSSLNELLKLGKKNYDSFKFFNADELRRVYNNDKFTAEYVNARESTMQELDDLYHKILYDKITPYSQIKSEKENNIEMESSKTKENKSSYLAMATSQNMPYHFLDLVSDTLNYLEYICMNISSKATDSSFIYQSLHQMFLRTVMTLAAEISVDNCSFSDKYYTNIIQVYNEWTTRYKKDLKKEKRKMDRINKKLNPKIKTV